MGRMMEWVVPALTIVAAAATTLWVTGAIYYDICLGQGGPRWSRGVGRSASRFCLWPGSRSGDHLPSVGVRGYSSLGGCDRSRATNATGTRAWPCCRGPSGWGCGHDSRMSATSNTARCTISRRGTRPVTVHLANLQAADIIFFNWGSAWMSHPVLVFDFGPDGRICISIEVRYRKGQDYSILRSLYRQQELIFLVADERDAILRRTKYGRPRTARLYHFAAGQGSAVRVPRLLGAINGLYETPRWYHGLCANCTTSFYRLPSRRAPRLAGDRQWPVGPGPLRGRPTGPDSPLRRTPAARASQRHRQRGAGSQVRGPHPARTGSATRTSHVSNP